MVAFASFIGSAALFATCVSALPMPDSMPAYAASTNPSQSWDSASASPSPSSWGWQSSSGDNMKSSSDDMKSSSNDMKSATAQSWQSSMASAPPSYGSWSSSSAAAVMATAAPSWGSSYGSSGSPWQSSADVMSSSGSSSYTPPPSATSSAMNSGSTMSYGSGSSSWDNSGYDGCVQQCVASYGAPPSMTTAAPPSYSNSSSSASSGTGMTHTVIVAPTQGVLRFVPFTTTADVGDVVEFVWHANNHTVTKSSELTPCNKTSDNPFSTGEQNEGFTFQQVVNDTNPVFYYCGTPTHCEKGMFGIINAPSVANNANASSVASMMPEMASNSSTVAAMMNYTANATSSNSYASSWGDNIDVSSMPEWSLQSLAENVLYTRAALGMNPSAVQADGSIDFGGANFVVPEDLAASATTSTPATGTTLSVAASGSAAPDSVPSAGAAVQSGSSNGAGRRAVSGGLFGVAALAAAFLAL